MNLAQIEKVAKALGDATRLKIYEHIASRGQVNCRALVNLRGITPATVSHHLRILSEAGLINCRREGQFVKNQANRDALEEFTDSLKKLAGKGKR
jgi:ArsR family transcriptional regulator